MPLLETKGAGSAQGFGLSLGSAEAVYVEEVFSTYLYTGTGATQTITNEIDLAGEGGLVWVKSRSVTGNNWAQDTVRGVNSVLYPNLTNGAGNPAGTAVSAFNTNGWTLGTNTNINNPSDTYVSWTFRKQPKFFDVVTYTGDGSANKVISHNLGSTPGAIIVKSTSATGDWPVLHRSLTAGNSLYLNSTVAQGANADWGNPYTAPTATTFNVSYGNTNASGVTYVAYLWAHDAGGFGLEGTDNVVSCGSFTTDAGGLLTAPINLGYEPQWVMYKRTNNTSNWSIVDTMRGFTVDSTGTDRALLANLSNAESNAGLAAPSATGIVNDAGTNSFFASSTYIYIAIRRGPMKVPTSGTQVFTPIARTGTDVNTVISGIGFATDLFIGKYRGYASGPYAFDRLRGVGRQVKLSNVVGAEASGQDSMVQFGNTSVTVGVDTFAYNTNNSISTLINYFFGRAPQFFDIVVDQGTGVAHTVAHNLGAAPELILRKARDGGFDWNVYYGSAGNFLKLSLTSASAASATIWNNTAPTSSVFSVGGSSTDGSNWAGSSYISYLFATCAGVSKVGSYTGTGTTQVINCGFTAGSRFVMIKRTDSTGDWYVWDSARGIVAGNDPYLLLNSTAAEVTNTDFVDTASTGFEISSTAPAAINANGGTFIFLAIA